MESFGLWLEQLQQHRFYRQNQINVSSGNSNGEESPSSLKTFHSPMGSLPRPINTGNNTVCLRRIWTHPKICLY